MKRSYFPLSIDYCCRAIGRYRFIFPFLVGAEQLMTGHDDFNITFFFEKLRNSYSNVLNLCYDLGEYIIVMHKKEYPCIGQLKKSDGLIINSATLEEFQIFDEGQWDYFTEENLKIIETAKAI